jgi:hypothetical protein
MCRRLQAVAALGVSALSLCALAGCGSDSDTVPIGGSDQNGPRAPQLGAAPAPGQQTGLDANGQQGTTSGPTGGSLGFQNGRPLAPGEQPGSGTPAPVGEPGAPLFNGVPNPPAPGEQTGRGD